MENGELKICGNPPNLCHPCSIKTQKLTITISLLEGNDFQFSIRRRGRFDVGASHLWCILFLLLIFIDCTCVFFSRLYSNNRLYVLSRDCHATVTGLSWDGHGMVGTGGYGYPLCSWVVLVRGASSGWSIRAVLSCRFSAWRVRSCFLSSSSWWVASSSASRCAVR